MSLNTVAGTVVVVWYLIASLLNIILIAVLAIALVRLNTKLDELTRRVDPLVGTADQLLRLANEKLTTMSGVAENLLEHGEAVAATVHSRTESTSTVIQRTIMTPFVGANALLSGITHGFATFSRLQTRRAILTAPKPSIERKESESEQ